MSEDLDALLASLTTAETVAAALPAAAHDGLEARPLPEATADLVGVVEGATDPGVDGPAQFADSDKKVLVFSVAETHYAVPLAQVAEVRRIPGITPVPRTPRWVSGITNVRGDVMSVVDLHAYLGEGNASPLHGRLLIVRQTEEIFSVGLLVDRVDQIVSIPAARIVPPAAPLEGQLAPFVRGLCEHESRIVAVLALDRFLRSTDIRQFDEASNDQTSADGIDQ